MDDWWNWRDWCCECDLIVNAEEYKIYHEWCHGLWQEMTHHDEKTGIASGGLLQQHAEDGVHWWWIRS